jgi:hypothetical protein
VKCFAIQRYGGAELASPYVADFVAELKSVVPGFYRTYDAAQRT